MNDDATQGPAQTDDAEADRIIAAEVTDGGKPLNPDFQPDDEPPMVDQPDPRAPLAAVPQAELPTGDALLVFKLDPQNAAGLHMVVMFDTEKPSENNVAHFFAKWISANFNNLIHMASGEFNAIQALRESEDRHRLRLVDPHGGIITATD